MVNIDEKRDRVIKAAFSCRTDLLTYARSLLGNFTAAEDVVHEAMIVVMNKYDQFQEGTSVLAWCRAIVRLEVLHAKRQYHQERSLAERLIDDAVDAAFNEFQASRKNDEKISRQEAIRHCLEKIPDRGRAVLESRFKDELGYNQIGEQLGMTIEAVRKSLFRLKKQLRSCVESRMRITS
jgi:RNA polymerase sigma-70 factor (ECF subfamily)